MSTSERGGAAIQIDSTEVEHVVEPETVDELREVARSASRNEQSILIVGGGTRLSFGNIGGPFDLAVSTRRLNHVIDYQPQDLTLAVEPGCTIRQINDLLSAEGQQLPIDVAHLDRATIGGCYAIGLSGPQRLLNGSLKDLVLGVEVVNADGTTSKAGGMVVKNVTGFDLVQLHYGSLGAFGLVSRLNLRVSPVPPRVREYRFGFWSAACAHRAGVALLEARIELMALYIVWSPADGWSLRVWLSGSSDAVEKAGERLAGLVREVQEPASQDRSDSTDGVLESFTRFVDLDSGSAVARFSVPASRQLQFLEALATVEADAICSDMGSGLIYVLAEPSFEWRDRMLDLGDPVFLSIPSALKEGVDVFGGLPEPGAGVVRNLKGQYDPTGRFNRGRFVLGL